MRYIILIVLLSLIGEGCTKECADKQTLQTYEIQLNEQIAIQKDLETQLKGVSDSGQRVTLEAQVFSSLAKEASIRASIDGLKKNSKCL